MDIKRNVLINAPIETVYQALSTDAGTKAWWNTRARAGEAVGEPAMLIFDKQGTEVKMGFRVDVLDENSRVEWECVANTAPPWIGTRLIYALSESDGGTSLAFTNSGWPEMMAGTDGLKQLEDTWDHFMQSIKAYCETGAGQPWG